MLDLFAGTGALGIEAASRGAGSLDAVDADAGAAREIEANLRRLGAGAACRAHRGDALAFAAQKRSAYDLVFIDPPYALGLQEKAVRAALPALKPEGLIYVEAAEPPVSEALLDELGLAVVRLGRAGAVHYELLARQGSGPAAMAKLPKEKGKKARIAEKARLKAAEETAAGAPAAKKESEA